MGLMLQKIQDPRDPLQKARRSELVAFAKRKGIEDIDENMPAELMRKILRGKGINQLDHAPTQVLGSTQDRRGREVPEPTQENTREVSAEADLERQWREHQERVKQEQAERMAARGPRDMTIQELRKQVKAHGLKNDRNESRADIIKRLEQHLGKDAS